MSRLPDERDMDQLVRSWMRDEEEHAADRNRQVGRIMGRIDETRQRRGAWRILPFGRGAKRVDEDDDELYAAGGGTLAARRGVSTAMAVAMVAVLIVMGAAFVALLPAPATGPGAQLTSSPSPSPSPVPTPAPTIHPEDVGLRAEFAGVWAGGRTTLNEVLAVYAEDAVHTSLWTNEVERFHGPDEIWRRIRVSLAVDEATWITLPDAGTGEHRYLGVSDNLNGIACVLWVEDALITRHDCILPASSAVGITGAFEPPADDETIAVVRALYEDLVPGWGTADRDRITRSVAPEIVHYVAYDNAETRLEGIDEYMSVMGYSEPEELTPPVPLPAPAGEHRWTDFSSVAGGSLCTFWERDGRIVRHDCIVPTFTYVPPEERGLPTAEPSQASQDASPAPAGSSLPPEEPGA